jgi:NAD+ diphosphatase
MGSCAATQPKCRATLSNMTSPKARAPTFTPGIRPSDDPDLHSGPALCFVFRHRELLVTTDGGLPSLAHLNEAELDSERSQFLGTLGDSPCHSVELSAEVQAPSGTVFRDLRALYPVLDETLHAVAGRAVQIMEWDRTHQFCGVCGKQTELSDSDRSRACPDCKIPQFPRLSPAMIVAVERGNEILLARSPHFPPGIYSVLAGFVEPGESAEEAVEREVMEEAGIRVKDIAYFSSQPWPYPNSLMLGFRATYASGEITLEDDEIEDARWFRADAMPTFFPGRMSISQWLIHDFLNRHTK